MSTSTNPVTERLEHVEAPGAMQTKAASRTLAVLRIATGFVFLWAFLDKTFGFGYATPSARAWVNGGSPTKGFLASVDVGPLQSFYHSIAGTWYADWGFMLGMLGIGLALIAGVGLRVAAGASVAMMALMWLAEYPLAQHTATGVAAGSTNPLIDYHIVYAIVTVVLALAYAGHAWGLGRWWASRRFVQRNRWLI